MATQDEILATLTDISNRQDALAQTQTDLSTKQTEILGEVNDRAAEIAQLISMIGSVPGSDAILAKAQEILTKMQALGEGAQNLATQTQAADDALDAIPPVPPTPPAPSA